MQINLHNLISLLISYAYNIDIHKTTIFIIIISISIFVSLESPSLTDASQGGTRPQYVYDKAGVITTSYKTLLDNYLRMLDDSTSAEIIVYTIPSFIGNGIKKDGQEIQDRDTLANYIFNEVSLDGIQGIGKKGKDNGVLLLLSLKPDSAGGSMRIEVGRGLEGNITDGIAGEILDTYLVPARDDFIENKNTTAINQGILNTVVALGKYIGFSTSDPKYKLTKEIIHPDENNNLVIIIFIMIFLIIILSGFRRRRRFLRRGGAGGAGGYWFGSGYGGGGNSWTGGGGSGGSFGGFGGGGGSSSGGGAGR